MCHASPVPGSVLLTWLYMTIGHESVDTVFPCFNQVIAGSELEVIRSQIWKQIIQSQ